MYRNNIREYWTNISNQIIYDYIIINDTKLKGETCYPWISRYRKHVVCFSLEIWNQKANLNIVVNEIDN